MAAIAYPSFNGLRSTSNLPSFSSSKNENSIKLSNVFSCSAVSRLTMSAQRKFFVGGNWKCNGNRESVYQLILDLNAAKFVGDVDVIVAPPLVHLSQVVNSLSNSAGKTKVRVSSQNLWKGKGGAFTGEVSADMLTDIGVEFAIVGHSERRHVLKESNEFIGEKVAHALSEGLKVIACVGELLSEREDNKTMEVIRAQLDDICKSIKAFPDLPSVLVIAYEPVWAIGTGKVASPEQAQEVHVAIRDWLKQNVGSDVAEQTRIIYGGSVNGKNCGDLAKKADIDGFLVGGASLNGAEFATICNASSLRR